LFTTQLSSRHVDVQSLDHSVEFVSSVVITAYRRLDCSLHSMLIVLTYAWQDLNNWEQRNAVAIYDLVNRWTIKTGPIVHLFHHSVFIPHPLINIYIFLSWPVDQANEENQVHQVAEGMEAVEAMAAVVAAMG